MAFIRSGVLSRARIVRPQAGRRQCAPESRAPGAIPLLAVALAVALAGGLLAGCSTLGIETPVADTVSTTYYGSVTADDPQAVDIGRKILLDGGSAADAAAAMGMALTVSLPSRAGIDGGGMCLVHDPGMDGADVLDFTPPPSGAQDQIPGVVRGLAALQARSGRFRWQQAVSPAETLARTGIAVTPRLLLDLAAAGLSTEGPGGKPLELGDVLPQRAVAETLSKLRVNGFTDLYRGALAARLAAEGVPAERLAHWIPTRRPARSISIGDVPVYAADGGAIQAALSAVAALPSGSDAATVFAAARAAVKAADVDAATTSFAVADEEGGAVSCTLTMGKLFGTGHLIEGLDVFAAAPADPSALAPLVAVGSGGSFVAAVSGGGGTAAAADAASVAWSLLAGGVPIDQAVAQKRTPADNGAKAVPERVNAIYCPGGSPANLDSCVAANDPRGSGFAATADRIQP